MIKNFLSAISFLTIFPVRKTSLRETSATMSLRGIAEAIPLSESLVYFPLVGMLLGGILVGVNYISLKVFPSNIALILVLIVLIILTGGLHLDGFADTVDGLYAGKNREQILKIMSDSHIGTMGVIGLICLLLLKYIVLTNISVETSSITLMLMPVLSRWSMVIVAAVSSPAKEDGLGKYLLEKPIKTKQWIIATLSTAILTGLLLEIKGIILMVSVLLVSLILVRFINKKIGGITGDVFGTVNEISELNVLIVSLLK